MRMTLNNMKMGLVASTLALSAVSCKDRGVVDTAKAEAKPYVSSVNTFDADRIASYYAANGTRPELAGKVVYWDSVVSLYKEKEAYLAGKDYMLKKHNGDKKVKPQKYPINFLTKDIELDGSQILNDLRVFVAGKTPKRDWLKMREKEPTLTINSASTPSEIMYWKHIVNAHRFKNAFKAGVEFVKDSLANNKKNVETPLEVSEQVSKNTEMVPKKFFYRTTVKFYDKENGSAL